MRRSPVWCAAAAGTVRRAPISSLRPLRAQSTPVRAVSKLTSLASCRAAVKVIVNQPASDHGEWGGKEFAPEKEFLEKLGAIEGISKVESQEYTMEAL